MGGGTGRVDGNGDYGSGREHLVHELQPLPRDFHTQTRYAREITSWPRQAAHHAQSNRVAPHLKDNRDRRGRRFCRERDLSAAGRDNYRYLTIDQICRKRGQSIVLTFCPTEFDRDVATLGISAFG